MPEQLNRREFLKTGAVGALAAAAGCDTSGGNDAMLAPGSGTVDLRLGEWRLAIRATLSDLDVDGSEPTVGVLTSTGEIALWNVEAGMSTNADNAEIVAEATLSDVTVNRFPTLAFLTNSGEMAVITEDSYNG
jgi:hypothetical protein